MAARHAARMQHLALALAGCLIACSAHAQWVPNGVPLTTASGGQGGPVIISDGVGGAIVAWGDGRDYSATSDDIYAQRVTADGLIAPGWPADGAPVCTTSGRQYQLQIASDGAGGAYVVWFDDRNYALSQTDVYIQRLTGTGAVAPGWAPNGNPVCTVVGDVFLPEVAPDGAGGAFVVWEDYRRGHLFPPDQVDIYAQRITPEGKPAPGWPVDGLPACTAAGIRASPHAVADGVGGVFIEWVDARNFAASQSDIYAVRISELGEVAPGWVVDGVPICSAPGFQNYAGAASDGAGGFVVAWQDTRSTPPGYPFSEDYYDICAQRVTASGSIAPGWVENGVPLCTAPELQQQLEVVADGTGGAIVVWSDYRDRFVTASDLYGQRVLASGEIAPGWPVNGALLSRLPGFDLNPTVVADGMGGALVAFETTTDEYYLYLQHVTAAGAIAPGWDPNGVPLYTLPGLNPHAVSDGKMGMIVAWEDFHYNISAQRVGGDFPTPTLISLVSVEAEPGRVMLIWSASSGTPAATVYRRGEESG